MQNIRTLLRTYQPLLVSAGVVLVVLVGLLVGVLPLAQNVVVLVRNNVTTSAEITALRTKNEILSSFDEDTLRTNLLTLTAAVPADKSLPTVLGAVDAVTGTTGVALTEFTLVKPGSLATESAQKLTANEKETGANILPLTISIAGTYDQVRAFISNIVSIRRFFRIRTVDVLFAQGGTVVVRLNIDTFYTPLPSSVGSVGSAITGLTDEETQTIDKTAAIQLVAASVIPENIAPSGGGRADPFSE